MSSTLVPDRGADASTDRITASWASGVLQAGRTLEEGLADRAEMERLTSALADIATTAGAGMVTGASPLGHQLAGLVAARRDSGVTLWAENGAHGTLLVIEGVLVSGSQVLATARRARASGAERVVAVAVVADSRGLALSRAALGDEVTALGEAAFSIT